MNIFELEIWYDCLKCNFYSVQWENAIDSETDKFFMRFEEVEHQYHDASNILFKLILDSIGNKFGAIDDFFDREEEFATALPPKPKRKRKRTLTEISSLGINFPLRLYCYRISPSIVVLFNGGIKTGQTVQESRDLGMSFHDAQIFAKRIDVALKEGMIKIANDGKTLLMFNNDAEIWL